MAAKEIANQIHEQKEPKKEKIIWVASPYTAVSAWLQYRF
jgi:hypothetical protein